MKGRRSAERRGVDSAGPARQADERLALRVLAARASFWKTRSPLGALPRLLPEALRAQGSVRSRASWSRTTDPLPGQPAPGRPATWPAGRVSEPPRDEVTSPIPGTAPAPSISRHRLTSLRTSEMNSFSSSRGVISRNAIRRDRRLDPTRLFLRCLFDSLGRNCDCGLIRIFLLLRRGRCGCFWIVTACGPMISFPLKGGRSGWGSRAAGCAFDPTLNSGGPRPPPILPLSGGGRASDQVIQP